MGISGATRIAGVIGSPVAHSLSPAIHNAAFAAAGLDWRFVAFEVAEGSGGEAVAAMRTLGIAGLSVTMPHKAAAAVAADARSSAVERLAAANCLVLEPGGRVRAESTDGEGFVRSLGDAGVEVDGARCLVLGAGGAARAVVLALAGAGASEVVVANRTPSRAQVAAELAGPAGRAVPLDDDGALGAADLVVNATAAGMGGGVAPVGTASLREGQAVADLVYQPVRTRLLEDAAQAGCVVVDGLGMLVHQAALAFEHWTGEPAPLDAMRNAVLERLPSS